jgi:hypothetical protein
MSHPRLLRILAAIESHPVQSPHVDTPCWTLVGLGRINRNGYVRLHVSGREPVVHRWLYTIFVGRVPERHVLDHLCRNRACIRWDHLEPVTHKINTRRGQAVLFAKEENRAAGYACSST